MNSAEFKLRTVDEVRLFQERLDGFVEKANGHPLRRHVDLEQAFKWCEQNEEGGRIFTALLDLHVNFVILWCDMHVVGRTWNQTHYSGRELPSSVLADEVIFNEKMSVHRYSSSFVLRYRALWDKVLGLLVLLVAPDQYKDFMKAKSRRRKFRKIAEATHALPNDFVIALDERIEEFDRLFRTAEAHGTGTLRKWTLTMEDVMENPQGRLIGYWNLVNEVVVVLGKLFSSSAAERT